MTHRLLSVSQLALVISCMLWITKAEAQLFVDTSIDVEEMMMDFFHDPAGDISISNITYTNDGNETIGFFDGSASNIGLNAGILLATGNITNAIGPNDNTSAGDAFLEVGDPDLDDLLEEEEFTTDAAVIEFDLVSLSSSVEFQYVFGSEEYIEHVDSPFGDLFALIVTGPGIPDPQNIALIPGTTNHVSINQVNNVSNAAYFIDNDGGTTIQYDGFTTVLTASLDVIPLETYHIKLVIADVGDSLLDSGLFMGIESLGGSATLTPTADFIPIPSDTNSKLFAFDNQSKYATSWAWDFGDGNTSTERNPTHIYEESGTYTVSLTATNYCCSANTMLEIEVLTDVWAGDANFDGIVNMDDLLALGLGYGNTGSARVGATLDWQAQMSLDWATSFTDIQFDGINHKHADCDGNGTIEAADTLAISLNYGLTHAKDEGEEDQNGVPLFWEVTDTILAGYEHIFAIHLGNTDTIAEDIYGIRFTAEFAIAEDVPDTVQINTPFATFNTSWLGTKNVDMLTLDTMLTENHTWDMALTRFDQTNQTGFGEICRLVCVMDVGSLKTTEETFLPVELSFKNVKIIRLDGSEIAVSPQSTTLVLKSNATNLSPILKENSWQVYPNPSTDKLFLKGNFSPNETINIQILNANGQGILKQRVKSAAANALSLDISHLAAGLYYVKMNDGKQLDFKKIIVTR